MNDTINHVDRVGLLTQFRRVALTQRTPISSFFSFFLFLEVIYNA